VHTGLFGAKQSFAPLYGSHADGDQLTLAVSKELVKNAPRIAIDEHMEQEDADALYHHYQGYLDPTMGQRADDPAEGLGGEPGIQSRDTVGRDNDDTMTRSEERLHVGTETVQTGKARLRKYIVEETVTQTVPLRHEEIRLEREPITDANRGEAMAGAELSEETHEITLHAERPVVAKETVAVERVTLAAETVHTQQQISESLRKEQIDQVDVDTGNPGTRR
jgi:uncharacterized protein (TIGR02271 family)